MRSLLTCTEGSGHEFAPGAVFRSNPADVESVIQELEEAIIRALEGSEKTATNARLNKTD